MEKDFVQKQCLADEERFADLINGLLLNGEPKVRAGDLQEADTQSVVQTFLKNHKKKYVQLYRDVVKKVAFGMNFIVIGVENQQMVHYLMPLRAMAYDVAEYQKQAVKIRKQVRKSRFITGAEFLSGFRKSDKIFPCVTIVLFYGEYWDGSKNLHELLDFSDIPTELREYINNYTVHVFEIMKLSNTDVFQTDLKQIFDFIRYSKDKRKIKELLEEDVAYQAMDEDAYDMIATYTNAKELMVLKKQYRKDGKVNMCKALKDWAEEERQAGTEIGTEIGKEIGKAEILSVIVCKKIQKNYTLDMIADDLELDVEEVRPIYEAAKKKLESKR